MTEQESTGEILIVDDTPANLRLLGGMLKDRGYKVRPVLSGKLALKAAEASPPDLVLLDINMPEMNGYEVCKKFKADPDLSDIPVIFISALNETMDKVNAFNVGGVDYVTKPFQFEEVEARVETHLRLRRQQIQLENQYSRLRELEELRDDLTHMVVHDMRSPLTAIIGGLEIVRESAQVDDADRNLLTMATTAAQELNRMVKSLLDVSRLESGEMPLNPSTSDPGAVAAAAVDANRASAEFKKVRLEVSGESASTRFDQDLIHRVFSNLIGNAIKFSSKGSTVEVRVRATESGVRAEVADAGPGIPDKYHEKIFEKFGQVEALKSSERHSTGLGLAFCKLAVEAHGGQIGVESEIGKGSTFWFELPQFGQ